MASQLCSTKKVAIATLAIAFCPTILGQNATYREVPDDWSAAEQWPPGELNCAHGFRKFDPLTQKRIYNIGVHAPDGPDVALNEFNLTFEAYLSHAVGKRWNPPIEFKMTPSTDPLRDWVDNKEDVDFMYSDTGLYSCIGVEIGGQPLGTTISRLTARGQEYNLDMFGGTLLCKRQKYAVVPAVSKLHNLNLAIAIQEVSWSGQTTRKSMSLGISKIESSLHCLFQISHQPRSSFMSCMKMALTTSWIQNRSSLQVRDMVLHVAPSFH